MVRDLVLSLIRTYIPIGVGIVLTWLGVRLDIEITEDMTTGAVALLVGVLSGLYYIIARLLESKWPVLSFLLGTPKNTAPPTYESYTARHALDSSDDYGDAR